MNKLRIKLDIQMFSDGKVVIDTELNTKNFENGLSKMKSTSQSAGTTIKNIVAGLGITKLISVAMSQINQSIDGAVARLDTLNNFPKVMSNLGIASEDAEKSIKKMSDKLAGLPTTLDQGASAVQRFTSANGDVKKSTDIFLSLNNAILAGGASTEIQASALEQLSQAYAKGKPDMMEWRTAMTAMPAQLKQVATAMGYVNADELGEALRNGTVSMDEFMDTITKLNEEGLEGFQSFEEQAKNSTGGIATSITVAKTQLVKGVTDIIDALNKSFENTKFGSLAGFIQEIGVKSKEILDKFAKYIPTIVNNLDKIIPMLGLLSVGFSTIKPDGILGISSALGGLVGKVNSSAGLITKVLTSGFGFATLGGLILVALGLAEENFGEGINKMLDTAIEKGPEIISNLINGIVSKLPDLMSKGKDLLIKLLDVINANLPNLITGGMQILETLVTGFTQALPDIIKSGMEIISNLIIGIAQQLPTLIPEAIEIILTLVESLIDNIDLLIDCALELIIGLAEGLIKALPILIEKIPIIIEKLVEKLTDPEMLGKIIKASAMLITELAIGLVKAIPSLVKGVLKINNAIINGLKNLGTAVLNIGKNIVKGIWQGISNSLGWIKDKLTGWVGNVTKFIKKLFGIHSPSKVMRDEVGKFLAQGIGVGFDDELDSVYKDMQKTIDFENAKLQANVESGKVFNSLVNSTPVEITLNADVDMDSQKVGRLITPSVARTIKTGGGY